MRHLRTAFFALFIPAICFAWNGPVVDSLKQELAHSKTDSVSVYLMLEIVYYSPDTTEKFSYCRKARALATKAGYKKGIGDALATEAYERVVLSDFSAATYLYTEALKVRTEIQDTRGLAQCYHELGLLDLQFKNYRHAYSNFMKAVPLNIKTNNSSWLSSNYETIASVYSETRQYDSAMFFLRKAEAIALENDLDASLLYHNMANLFLKMNQPDSCRRYIQKSDAEFELAGDTYGRLWNKMLTGDLFLIMGKPAEAIPLLEEVYARANQESDGELLLAVIPELLEAYHLTGNYQKGFPLQYEWNLLKDSLISLDKANLVTGLQVQYETEEKEKIDQLLADKVKAEHEAESGRMKLIIYSVSAILLLVTIMLFFIFRNYREKKKANEIISRQKEMVEEKQREIVDSITYAKRLQEAILPPEKLVKQHFPESFILYLPKAIVAGDFYWMEAVGKKVFIAAADCTGHGVPGAMVSVVCCNALNRAVKEFGLTDPGRILDKVRELVLETFEKSGEEVKDGMDISLLSSEFGVVSSETGTSPNSTLRTPNFSWAGANNPLWYVSGNEIMQIKADKQPVGKQENAKDFTTHRLQVPAGGMVYLFTDGFADQFGGPKGKKFRYKQLEEVLLSIVALPANDQKQKLETAFADWKGDLEQIDDVCIIGIRV
jgi:tetratricopeptide (TPR) repeat protein